MGKSDLKKLPAPTSASTVTLSELQQDGELQYRIKVLLYDLNNISNDPMSDKRISSTTDSLYISEPYFTENEATRIRSALVTPTVSVQDAIQQGLSNFFDKRRASGDARPCGPHDMVPVYCSVLDIRKDDLKDENFLSRLRRSGLKRSPMPVKDGNDVTSKKKGKKTQ